MTSDIKCILDQCRILGIVLEPTPDGEHLDLHYCLPPPEGLRQLLRAHKQEIISQLKPQSPQWHAQRIAQAVLTEGVCLFWSDMLQEMIAFIRDETFRGAVPAGVVAYTSDELWEPYGTDRPPASAHTLRMIHEAKRAGGRVASREME